ncbi:KIR protein [Plasmodium knowlesi strain H]|uniref:KIR protein n=3 Tax=Plasmodium knowlesi TaxID=5850 RepID=A0A5K1VAH6_PLAKH|nr:KIR protein [Plasmodium knowlesi strain H]OTN64043.1 KIR protein [Plasmodium knowlesi]CAA9991294.1 KIR protein [Plasmodium knowlesi strain H]SBO26392.1 KIR protein [Plasmodium knowlesi strain H]SBO28999.1 KIR protein [Plasmodium knowlesi strain H]VVS80768.1 KIR protein [Plasmodium knowlesi strain H]|eukprot:XP_002262573.1 KIR protein [Plasmodium knowlesi strain H]
MSTAPNLKNLPSKKEFYNKFWTGKYEGSYRNSCAPGWEDKLKGKLSDYRGLSAVISKIIDAYCYVSKVKGEGSDPDIPCLFFYYWLGNMVPKDANTYKLSDVLGAIYQALEDTDYSPKCKIIYEDVDRINFELRRRIHDFAYNYKTIQGLVEKCESAEAKEYLRFLQRVSGACRIVGVDCPEGGVHGNGTYCDDYNKKYKEYCETELRELQEQLKTCLKPNPNPNQAGSSGSLSDAQQEGDDLGWLPSKKVYTEIVRITDPCGDDGSLISGVEEAVKAHREVKEEANSIAKYICYSLGKKDTLSGGDPSLYYVYYHVGNTYSSYFKKDDSSFWKFMGTVSQQLGELPVDKENKCKIELSHIDTKDFIWEKRMYDYYKDYETIKEKLQYGESPCSTELDQYLTEAAIGYKLIHRYCNGKTEGKEKAFCDKFKTKYDEHKPEELLGEKCISNLEDEISAYAENSGIIYNGESGEDTASAEIASIFSFARDGPIASSGLAAVGLPAIAYLLYKYTSLPSWLREQFGGRSNNISRSQRRARRSTGPNFSNFTEDVSTEVPTEYSSYLSTLYPLEESIENNSTTYYEEPPQPSPRRRGQQQGQRRRRGPPPPRGRQRANNEYRYVSGQNISYYRM